MTLDVEKRTVESSAILAVSYREAEHLLTVWFPDREGSVWEYRQVTAAWWAAFLAAPSKGKFFMGIKLRPEQYPCRRVSHRFDPYGLCKDCGLADTVQDSLPGPYHPCQPWPDGAVA